MASTILNLLQGCLTDFSPAAREQKVSLLNRMCDEKLSLSEIKNYHDKLLFLSAYADSAEVREAVNRELLRISDVIKSTVILRSKLLNSGIVFTASQSTYTLALIKWLIQTFPGTVCFHSFDEGALHPKEIFKHLLPQEEFEILFDDMLNPLKWLQKSSGSKNPQKQIEWIVNCFEESTLSSAICEHLFESMKVYVEIDPKDLGFSRSFGRVSIKKHFYHPEPLLKKINEKELITSTLPVETKLNERQRGEIISAARVALCLLKRETDPITYSESGNIKYFELERGLSIALFSMDEEQCLSLESYIGFMMFKNGYPMSYGGAWLFGKRALIGINIFEAFRGGESAVVFAQLLRTYHKAFGAEYFEVEPYQFGKNNPEGIKSGAFWFYYRFGFRPVNEELHSLSLYEYQKINSEKGYRSSFETLKKFTRGNLFLNLGTGNKLLNPSDLSKFITGKINRDFNGNRKKAVNAAKRILKKEGVLDAGTRAGVLKSGMFFAFCLDFQKINSKNKSLIRQLIIAKTEDEFNYISLLNKFSFEKYLKEGL